MFHMIPLEQCTLKFTNRYQSNTVNILNSSCVTLSVPLLCQQREAYAPRIFFEASRPPWFTPRSQQDCSEYLRFLLDRYSYCAIDGKESTVLPHNIELWGAVM